MLKELRWGKRCKVKNQCIFGTFCGYDTRGKVLFLDEELGTIKKYSRSKIETTYERLP